MSQDALNLAQAIAHELWETYDDTYGYRSEKQERNHANNLTDPDAMWFIWNQFDVNNQHRFIDELVNAHNPNEPGAGELRDWLLERIVERSYGRYEQ